MKMILKYFLIIGILFLPKTGFAATTLKLLDCYNLALKNSQTLVIDEQQIRIAEAHYRQALGVVLPHLSFNGLQTFQDTSGVSSGSPFGDGSATKLAFTVEQPLFQGFREFKAMRVAHAEKQKNSAELERAKQLLFFDVTKAYYSVLAAERELDVAQNLVVLLRQRLDDLQERIRVGKSRPNDALLTSSEMNAAQAHVSALKASVATVRDYLGFLTGQSITQNLVDEFAVPQNLQALTHWQDSVRERGDVKAAMAGEMLAKGEVDYNQSLKWPTLNLAGNYYPYRTGVQEDIDWDLGLSLKVPLYSGGSAKGVVDEARAKHIQAGAAYNLAEQQAELEINQAYHNVKSAQEQYAFLSQAEKQARSSYDLYVQDFELSQVNNLNVLDALKIWQNQKIQSVEAFYQTKLNYLKLLVASGKLPL